MFEKIKIKLMHTVTLLHNPGAGDEEHSGKELVRSIESAGYNCRYISVKDYDWTAFRPQTELIAIAGGDGTVRKAIVALLSQNTHQNHLFAILPSGTANNIAASLDLSDKPFEKLIESWKKKNIRHTDAGLVHINDKEYYFLESFGYGLLPQLIMDMKNTGHDSKSPAQELKRATRVLHQLSLSYPTHPCHISIDGKDHSGDYLMVEVSNMPYAGPNVNLDPSGNPGDGLLDITLVSESDRMSCASKIAGTSQELPTALKKPLKGREISVLWNGNYLHTDDEIIELQAPDRAQVTLLDKQLRFLIP